MKLQHNTLTIGLMALSSSLYAANDGSATKQATMKNSKATMAPVIPIQVGGKRRESGAGSEE